MTQHYPFSVKFKIFNNCQLSIEQQKIREKLCDDFHLILKNSINEYSNTYKYLERCEPSISSIDENKQLRMCFNSFMNTNKDLTQYIIFTQNEGNENFSLEEIKVICQQIKQEIEEYLHYGIDAFIYIDIDDI